MYPRRKLPTPRTPTIAPKDKPDNIPSGSREPEGLPHQEDGQGEISVEEEMKGVMDSLDLDLGDLSSEKIEETDWEVRISLTFLIHVTIC